MSDSNFEALLRRLLDAGEVYTEDGSVHVADDTWHALDADQQQLLVRHRDAIRSRLEDPTSGVDTPAPGAQGVPTSPAGTSNAQLLIDNAASQHRHTKCHTDAGDGSTGASSEGVGSTVEGSAAVSASVTAGDDSEGADHGDDNRKAAGGDSDAPRRDSDVNLVSVSQRRGRATLGPRTKSKVVSTNRYTPPPSVGSPLPGRPVLRGRARIDVDSLEWAARRIERHNSRERLTQDAVRRDAERDFGKLGELHLDARGWR